MIAILILLILMILFSLRVCINGLNCDYLSKPNTEPIKGIFVIIIFLSHIRTYADFSHWTDLLVIDVLNYFGQLMVAMFLFYSGYGIYESFKNKGRAYIKGIPQNRFGKTFFDFALAICLFLFTDIIMGIEYPADQIALAFTGWTTIGNSNWYMFAVFTLYLLTFLCFMPFKNNKWVPIVLMTICSLGYVYIMSLYKENFWSSTYLCYVAGMWYSYFKNNLDEILDKYHILYYAFTICVIAGYLYMFDFRYVRLMMFNAVAVLFCIAIVLVSKKIYFKSRILSWFGKYVFWIYILQRIPMRLLSNLLGLNEEQPYLYLFICLLLTLLLAVAISKFSIMLKRKIWK
jgi:hypothetical protein